MASSVNANAVLCVKGEIHNVLTVLRLNSRWASRERFRQEVPLQAESPLARAFKALHSHLEEVDDLANVDTVRYLLPFLAVVESPATTGPMTGVALSSLHKFLLYGFIRKDCPRVKEGISLVAQAISRCHFEETDPESDTLVLMKLLELSALCLRCEVGDLLDDESCWNIFMACYNLYDITTGEKAYALLRDTAGNTLAHIVLMLFSCQRVSRASHAPPQSPLATPVDGGSHVDRSPRRSLIRHRARSGSGGMPEAAAPEAEAPRPRRQTQRPEPGTNASGSSGDPANQGTREAVSRSSGGEEEEPWPSLDGGSGDDGFRRGVTDSGTVAAERGALKAMMGSSGGGDPNGSRQAVSPARVRREINGSGGGISARGEAPAEEGENVLVKVMRFLSILSDPRSNGGAECVLSLSLINIALEAGGSDLGRIPSLVKVMRGDLCKHLLQNSHTDDLNVLSLTLRVVFNLFNSIKDHLKVQLEVFLTSVHLRVLDGSSYGPEQQELALESLLEFTREPALMIDVYINYDCDVQCTNLFETICHSLSSHALPRDGMEVNALNRLALEGILAVIDSISRRCRPPPPQPALAQRPTAEGRLPRPAPAPSSDDGAGLTWRRESLSDSDSEYDLYANVGGGSCSSSAGGASRGQASFAELHGNGNGAAAGGTGSDRELGWLERARARTAEVLQGRKKMKRRLGLAAQRFNTGSKEWLAYAQELGLIPSPATPAATAAFLKNTLLLDKSMLGDYLSRGPAERYPFHAKVLEEYVKLFDMRDKTFVEALRAFLKEFRLPGEAQCIDRLMEAFAGQQYEQGKGSGRHPFVSADAAFTMAFSAIMLNTDLHNPQIADHRRMSLDDFVRNNRQINGGEDLPREFLEDVYASIRDNEIQVHRDHVSMAADGLGIDYTVHWDGILNRSNDVASASFTPSQAARKHLFPAGLHERDMLLSVTGPASEAMRAVFLRTRDDLLVLACLRGFRSHASACVYLGLLAPFDAELVFCFERGLEYAAAAAAGAAGLPLPEVLKNPGLPDVTDMTACAPFASGCVVHRDLLALKCGLELARAYPQSVSTAWGPLLECVFALADLQALPARMTDVDDFGDAQGNPLPPSIFAKRCRDRARSGQSALMRQSGRVRAAAAAASSMALSGGVRSSGSGSIAGGAAGGGGGGSGGLWGSLSGVLFSRAGEVSGAIGRRGGDTAAEAAIGAIAEVVQAVHLEQLFPQTKDLPLEVVEGLLNALLTIRDPGAPRRAGTPVREPASNGSNGSASMAPSSSFYDRPASMGGGGSGIEAEGMAAAAAAAASFEAHAVLALELSSRVVLANRHRIARLWPALHVFLARVLGGDGSVTMTRMPFLVERAMVTVLRACIHMLDRADMEALLLQSLRLLLSLPPDFVLPLSNRLASGLLILIQANASALSLPSTTAQWNLIATLMQKAAVGDGGRGFVLEALAFIVNRGVGLLGRQNVLAAHSLLTRFARGDFGDGAADFAWSSQARVSLEAMTFKLLQDAQDPLVPGADADTSENPNSKRGHASSPVALEGYSSQDQGGGVSAEERSETAQWLTRDEAEGLWLSTLQTLSILSGSAYAKVARGASEGLGRLVLQSNGVRPETWGTAFEEVLLELPVILLPPTFRPTAGERVRGTWNEQICLRCCTILSRAFLHHLQALASLPRFPKLWLDTVALLSNNLTSEGAEGELQRQPEMWTAGTGVAAESCQQMLTNMIMVVAYAGLLGGQAASDTGPGDASGGGGSGATDNGNPRGLLTQTRQIIEPVCPSLVPLLQGLTRDSAPHLSPPYPEKQSSNPLPDRERVPEKAQPAGLAVAQEAASDESAPAPGDADVISRVLGVDGVRAAEAGTQHADGRGGPPESDAAPAVDKASCSRSPPAEGSARASESRDEEVFDRPSRHPAGSDAAVCGTEGEPGDADPARPAPPASSGQRGKPVIV